MSHTPGPWDINRQTVGIPDSIAQNVYVNGIHIGSYMGQITENEIEANAHLVSASPDMLKALELLPLDYFNRSTAQIDAADFTDKAFKFLEAMDAARAAIAKARRKS